LQTLQLGDILVECLLAVGAVLIAALRERYVTGDDRFSLLLHFVDLALLNRRLHARACRNSAVWLSCVLCETHAPNISAVEQ